METCSIIDSATSDTVSGPWIGSAASDSAKP